MHTEMTRLNELISRKSELQAALANDNFNLESRIGNSLQSMCHCDAKMTTEKVMPEPESMWSACDTQLEAGSNSENSISQLAVYMRSMLISKAPMTMLLNGNENTYMTHNEDGCARERQYQELYVSTLD